ncbi:hypothetical protein AGLY_014133, partial [Aphis glycines]
IATSLNNWGIAPFTKLEDMDVLVILKKVYSPSKLLQLITEQFQDIVIVPPRFCGVLAQVPLPASRRQWILARGSWSPRGVLPSWRPLLPRRPQIPPDGLRGGRPCSVANHRLTFQSVGPRTEPWGTPHVTGLGVIETAADYETETSNCSEDNTDDDDYNGPDPLENSDNDSASMKSTESNEDDVSFKYHCAKCNLSFKFNCWYQRHMLIHKPGTFACQYCPKLYKRKDILREHQLLLF